MNEQYSAGDGKNLELLARMKSVPDGFADTVKSAFHEPSSRADRPAQRELLCLRIDSVIELSLGV